MSYTNRELKESVNNLAFTGLYVWLTWTEACLI